MWHVVGRSCCLFVVVVICLLVCVGRCCLSSVMAYACFLLFVVGCLLRIVFVGCLLLVVCGCVGVSSFCLLLRVGLALLLVDCLLYGRFSLLFVVVCRCLCLCCCWCLLFDVRCLLCVVGGACCCWRCLLFVVCS